MAEQTRHMHVGRVHSCICTESVHPGKHAGMQVLIVCMCEKYRDREGNGDPRGGHGTRENKSEVRWAMWEVIFIRAGGTELGERGDQVEGAAFEGVTNYVWL